MKIFIAILICSCLLSVSNASPLKNPPESAAVAKLNTKQLKAANAIVSELLAAEKNTGKGSYYPLFEDRVDALATDTPALLNKLPASRLKRYLALAIEADSDTLIVVDECNKYRYYDLIKNQQTPKIIAKFHLPYSLQSNLPYQQLDTGTVRLVITALNQIAAAARDRAQTMLSHT